MTAALDYLLDLLDLEAIDDNIFRGKNTNENRQRTFGGLVAGQALVAAGRTVDASKQVHSLHAYFLRPGDAKTPTVYQVDRIREGRSFATRRVVAIQHGEAIFNLQASFHVTERGASHHHPMPDVPRPENLPTFNERFADQADEMGDWYHRPRPIDTRFLVAPSRAVEARQEPVMRMWFRADGDLPDDPLLHACVVAYTSDMSLLDSILVTHGLKWDDGSMMGASLDHAMWFHRPFRADDWVLYDMASPSAHGARGLALGNMFTDDGTLVVTVAQEGLIRLTEKGRARQ